MNVPVKIEALINARAVELGIPKPESDTDLFQNGILDSFAVASLISAIEEELKITIPDSDVDESNLISLRSIVNYIRDLQIK